MKAIFRFLSALCVVASLSLITTACAPKPQKEGTGEYLDDSVITGKVKAAILKDDDLKVTEINVETFKGVVQLSGFVSSKQSIQKAIELTRSISGVKSVVNKMTVK
ncbi:MAG TPA: BON domain-containing protein [Cellvibrionaceae bacterium]